jgi:hypothetical protein
MIEFDPIMAKAMKILLGRYWKERLLRAMKDAAAPASVKRRRINSPEEIARRRAQMIAMNQARARMKQDMTDPCCSLDDWNDAIRMLHAGKSAAEIHKYLGGGLGWWIRWHTERKHGRE